MLHESVKINNNLFCYIWQGMGNNCNTCLFPNVFENQKPHLLIDPGHIQNEYGINCLQSLTESISKDGFSIKDVGYIINTHCHSDHCQACEELSRNNEITIAMSEEEENFRHGGNERLNAMFGIKSPTFTTSKYIKEGEFVLGKGNLKFQIFLSPGHSPGSICLYLPEDKILITGDVIFYGSIGRTDFPGGDISLLKKSIERLSRLDIEYLVPGHSTELGSIIQGKQNIERNFKAVQYFFQN